MRWRSIAERVHDHEGDRRAPAGTDSATTIPVRQPSDRKLTASTMTSASSEGALELEHRLLDDLGLVGDLGRARSPAAPAHELGRGGADVAPKDVMLAPLVITTPIAERRTALPAG